MIDAIGFTASGSAYIGLLSFAVLVALQALRIVSQIVALHEVELNAARRVFCRRCTTRSIAERRARTGRDTPSSEEPPPPYPTR